MDKIKKAKRLIRKELDKNDKFRELNIVVIADILSKNIGRLDGGWESVSEIILKKIFN